MVDAKVALRSWESVIQALLLPESVAAQLRPRPAAGPMSCVRRASTGEALAKIHKGIEVKPGEIVIPFTN